MPRRKKYPKLPNGYGQIRYLGKGRRNSYGVYPPATEEYDNGQKKTPPALCYVSDRMVGIAVLTSYHAGTYNPGDEILIEQQMRAAETGAKFFERMMADYNKAMFSIEAKNQPTFDEVFHRYYKNKFGREYGHSEKKTSLEKNICVAYKKCTPLHNIAYEKIRADDMQKIIDEVANQLSHSSAELPLFLFNQMDKYALANDICEKGYAQYVRIKIEDDDEHGIPFSDHDLKILWNHAGDETVEFLLIMCYSGFRINAYKTLEINWKEKYFKGGLKTDAGKDRIVPIHSAIQPLVQRRIKKYGELLPTSDHTFRKRMYVVLKNLGIDRHTPHDCRHTFSRLCEKFEVNENDRKRMIGHSFKNDITNGIYGHRTTEELREQIEKIKVDLL